MKISIITWDASFRESFHTVRFFMEQNFDPESYEFIWVDFYENKNPELIELISRRDTFHLVNLKNPSTAQWHLGKCINEGVLRSNGDILIIPDGDIAVMPNLLNEVYEDLEGQKDKVMYYRRWDEIEKDHHPSKSFELNYLNSVCRLLNPTNYAGLLSVNKSAFEEVNGYEEHEIFSGPGANGFEQYLRFSNSGKFIKWHPSKIFHPYHKNTGSSDKQLDILKKLKSDHPWLNPYNGIKQSWFLRESQLRLRTKAGENSQEIVDTIPTLEKLKKSSRKKRRLIHNIFR